MSPSVTLRNTKTQIMDAYTALLANYETLQARARAAERGAKAAARRAGDSAPPKGRAAPAEPDDMSIAGVLGQLDSLKLHFGSAASDISGKLTAEATHLAGLRGDIGERLEQLRLLHSLEVDGEPTDTVRALLDSHAALSASFATSHTAGVDAFEAELAAEQAAWTRELGAHNRTVKARDSERSKQRKREQAHYTYTLQRTREREAEEQAVAQAAREKALNTEIATQDSATAAREAALAEREAAVAAARSEAEGLDDRMETARKQAAEEGAAIARRQARIKADRLAKQVAGEHRVLELEVSALDEQVSEQDTHIKHLNAQIEATLKQIQDLAVQSIKGAEQASSFETLKRIAIEQARTGQKGK